MSLYTYRRGSIFWALTLIVVGALFLWQNFNPNIHPWRLLAKFWPVLIIFWGISKLIDYMQAQAHPDTVPPPLFSGSEVLMLILILALGTLVSKAVLHNWHGGGPYFHDDEISDLFLNSYTYTQNFSRPVEEEAHLNVEDLRGDMDVRGADQKAIDVTAKESIRAEDESAAKKLSDSLKLELVDNAGQYFLRSNRQSLDDEGRRITIDESLRVPTSTSCDINNERGDISVDGLHGDQTLTTHKGDVHAADVKGLVKIHAYGGDTQIHGVTGNVELDGRGDDVDIADISDTVTVHGEFTGALQFRNVAQTLRYESLRTKMTAQKLQGSLEMEVGALEVNGIDGPLEVTTRQKDVSIDEFKHSVHVTDSDAQVTLQTSAPPTHDIQIESKNGAVELTLPPSSNFQIDARSHHGEVDCDFSGPALKVTKDGDTPSISGSFGNGGPMIRLNTEYGAIRILRAGSKPPAPPAPPQPSVPPGNSHTTAFVVRAASNRHVAN